MSKQIYALQKLYERLGFGNPDVFEDYDNNFLTRNTTRSGRPVLWYLDANLEAVIYIDTGEFLTAEEIKDQLQ